MSLLNHLLAVTIVTAVAATTALPATAAGYYNLPTSLPQCLGLGYGPGYHAPLLLGRALRAETATQPVRRLPAPLSPPQAYGFRAYPRAYQEVSSGRERLEYPTVLERAVSNTSSYAIPHGANLPSSIFSASTSTGAFGSSEGISKNGSSVSEPAFAPPTLLVPQQAVVPRQPVLNYQEPSFPSARATQKSRAW